ncbi:hypothetical protein GCM10010434_023960 [Winogradskya humida]
MSRSGAVSVAPFQKSIQAWASSCAFMSLRIQGGGDTVVSVFREKSTNPVPSGARPAAAGPRRGGGATAGRRGGGATAGRREGGEGGGGGAE